MHYKLVKGTEVVDALAELSCVKYNRLAKRPLRCGEDESPGGVITSDGSTIYHVDGWAELDGYDTVHLFEISKVEYDALREQLDSNVIPEDSSLEELAEEEEKTAAQILKEQIDKVAKQAAGFAGAPEDAFIATQNYAKGSVIIVGGSVYKTVRNVERGAKIVPYLNVVQTNLAEIISES